jgi:hypothetical protein
MGDGLATSNGGLPSPRTKHRISPHSPQKSFSSPLGSSLGMSSTTSSSFGQELEMRPMSTSLFDGPGSDITSGISDAQASKSWSQRSMKEMVDYGTVPARLPMGISESDKKLWLAIYVKARELLVDGQCNTVRAAVDDALRIVCTERDSIEFRFGKKKCPHCCCCCDIHSCSCGLRRL